MNILKNPIFITLLIILLGGGILFYAFTRLGVDNLPQAAAVERSWGKSDSKVVITEYSDFQCPACKSFNDSSYQQLKSNYEDKIKFVYKHYPLKSLHPSAERAAEAAEAAGAQGKFWEYHEKLFSNQQTQADINAGDNWTVDELVQYAKDLGLDTVKFEKELRGNVYEKVVNDSMQEAIDKGYTGTPTLLINDQKIDNPSYENIEAKIKEILGEQNVAAN